MSTWVRKKRTQQRMLQMSAMSNPNLLYYKGTWQGFQTKLNELTNNPHIQITDVHAVILGDQTKQPNTACCILTGILGFIFILPLIVMCCEWWNKLVQPAFQIPLTVYQNLYQLMIRQPNIKTLNIQVKDNSFTKQKANLFYELLTVSQVKQFTFYNSAATIDYKEAEFTDFVENMKQIKMLSMSSYIRWYNDIIN